MDEIIKMSEITKSFQIGQRKIPVLRGVDLSVKTGEMLAIMGPSGSGKSTLLNIIGCIDAADSGKYFLNGKERDGKNDRALAAVRNRYFGYVVQDFALIEEDTVWENVVLPLEYSRKKHSAERLNHILDELGLTPLKKKRVSLLSGGEKQRTAIARALACSPDIILADEPTGALDSETGERVIRLLRKICDGGRTVLIVTHDPAVAAACDRTLHMRDGRLVDPACNQAAHK